MILYDPAVPGAVDPLVPYFPDKSVIVLGMVIGEVALNDIVMPLRYAPVDVSFSVPDILYVPFAGLDDGVITKVKRV